MNRLRLRPYQWRWHLHVLLQRMSQRRKSFVSRAPRVDSYPTTLRRSCSAKPMADVYASLMWSAVLRRAALLEQWRLRHAEHYPGPQLETTVDDYTITTARCSCGA